MSPIARVIADAAPSKRAVDGFAAIPGKGARGVPCQESWTLRGRHTEPEGLVRLISLRSVTKQIDLPIELVGVGNLLRERCSNRSLCEQQVANLVCHARALCAQGGPKPPTRNRDH